MFNKFLSSAIRQVGRDLGKVVSNQVFGDAHATPIRHVNRIANIPTLVVGTKSTDRRRKTDFEKSLGFRMTYTPKTLLNKLVGAFVEFKNEVDYLMSDDYLSSDEALYFISMLQDFSNKAGDVAELLEMNPKTSEEDISFLSKISEDLKLYVYKIAKSGYEGCVEEIKEIDIQISKIDTTNTSKWLIVWAGLFIIAAIAGYIIWKPWFIYVLLVSVIGIWIIIGTLSSKKTKIVKLQNRRINEISIKRIFHEMIQNYDNAA